MKKFTDLPVKEQKVKITKTEEDGNRYVIIAGTQVGEYKKKEINRSSGVFEHIVIVRPICVDTELGEGKKGWSIKIFGQFSITKNIQSYGEYLWNVKHFGIKHAKDVKEKRKTEKAEESSFCPQE